MAGAVAMAAATAFVVARQPGEWTAEEFIMHTGGDADTAQEPFV
jgi:hypothetical protein